MKCPQTFFPACVAEVWYTENHLDERVKSKTSSVDNMKLDSVILDDDDE